MAKTNFYEMAVMEAMDHPDLPEANRLADAFREMNEVAKEFEHDAYRLAYLFYSGVGWESLTDRERKAFLIWQESIHD